MHGNTRNGITNDIKTHSIRRILNINHQTTIYTAVNMEFNCYASTTMFKSMVFSAPPRSCPHSTEYQRSNIEMEEKFYTETSKRSLKNILVR